MKAPKTAGVPSGSRRGSAATDFITAEPAGSFVAAGKLQCIDLSAWSVAALIRSSGCDLQMT